MSNQQFKSSNFKIYYGEYLSPFGKCLVGLAGDKKSLCHLWFLDDNFKQAFDFMKNEWPGVELIKDNKSIEKIAKIAFSEDDKENIQVFLKGTDFQVKVWKALINIPRGDTITYSDVAKLIGNPNAIRATAKVIAINRIAYVIPCHRVLPKTGISKYRWTTDRRLTILNFEKNIH